MDTGLIILAVYVLGVVAAMYICIRSEWDPDKDWDIPNEYATIGIKMFGCSIGWPIVALIMGSIMLGKCAKFAKRCPDCAGNPVAEGFGGRPTACARCKGRGEILITGFEREREERIRQVASRGY